MPSPVGHLIAGYAIHTVMREWITEKRGYVLAAVLFSALAADLDFLPGVMIGAPGRFHHEVSHSLSAALLYGIGIWGVLQWRKIEGAFQLAVLFATVYVSLSCWIILLLILVLLSASLYGGPWVTPTISPPFLCLWT
jgi:hypothetical protein